MGRQTVVLGPLRLTALLSVECMAFIAREGANGLEGSCPSRISAVGGLCLE